MPPAQAPQAPESDTSLKSLVWNILLLATLLGLCALPALLVGNTNPSVRNIWYGSVAMLAVMGVFSTIATMNPGQITKPESARLRAPVAGVVLFALFAAVIVLSVVFANLKDTHGFAASLARIATRISEPVFPWIGNFRRARVDWGLSDLQVMKTEALSALWFEFGLLTAAFCILRWVVIGRQQREREYGIRTNRKDISGIAVMLISIFFIYAGASQFFGWWDFDGEFSAKDCIIHVLCYYQDDLLAIVAAGMRCFWVFGFPIGAMLFVRDYLRQRM